MNIGNKTSNNYSIIIPPLNVIEMLHMYHALNMTIQNVFQQHSKIKKPNYL